MMPPFDDCEWCGSELTILGVNSEGWIAVCANGHQRHTQRRRHRPMIDRTQLTEALPPVWEMAHRLQDAIGDSMERHPMISLYDLIMDDGVVQAWVRAMIETPMTFRTQLTEALARFTVNLPEVIRRGDQEGVPFDNLEGYAGDVVRLAEAARILLDFPTDEQVDAALRVWFDNYDLDEIHEHHERFPERMREVLEAVRRVMIGETDG